MNILSSPSRLCVGALTLYLIVILSCYFKNMGGEGLSLPQNLICWMVMVFVVANAAYIILRTKTQRCNLTVMLFIIAAILMLIPLLWSPALMTSGVILRFAGLWGGVIFYWALSQLHFSDKQKELLLNALCLATLIQGGLAIWQLTGPDPDNWMEFNVGLRPYGIFQQVNLLASFMATGWAISLYRLLTAHMRYQIFIWLLVNVFLSLVLQLLQSRTGLLSAVFCLCLVTLMRHKNKRARVKSYLSIIAVAAFFVLTWCLSHWMLTTPAVSNVLPALTPVSKSSSSHERIAILQATWQMIKQHPLSGWGYGSYEYVVNRLSLNTLHHLFPENVSHPHNELIFEWAEGGLPAVMGMLLLLAGALLTLRKASWERVALWGALIPIATHTMTEYPLYQSTPHLLALLLLLRLADNDERSTVRPASRALRYTLPVMVLTGMLFLITGFRTETALLNFEREGMQDFSVAEQAINPWAQYDRYHYDRATSWLMDFNRTHDPALLDRYLTWGKAYLSYKDDVHVFNNLVAIDKMRPDRDLTRQLENEWRVFYRARRGVTPPPLT